MDSENKSYYEHQQFGTRIGINTTAKGLVQFDIKCFYETPELSATNLEIALNRARQIVKEQGFEEAK